MYGEGGNAANLRGLEGRCECEGGVAGIRTRVCVSDEQGYGGGMLAVGGRERSARRTHSRSLWGWFDERAVSVPSEKAGRGVFLGTVVGSACRWLGG